MTSCPAPARSLSRAGLVVSSIVLLLNASSFAAERTRGPADPDLPFLDVVQVDAAPVLDGKLDDPCWQKARDSGPFADEYGFPVKDAVSFKACQHGETLYLGLRATYAAADGLKEPPANTKVHDGDLWQGEELELFLDTDNDLTSGYYQICITPQGTTGDWFCPEPKDPEALWEPKYTVRLHWTPTEWTVEYALPFSIFDRTATMHSNWGVNICRVWKGTACWSPNRGEGFHFPHRYGELRGIQGKDVVAHTAGRFRTSLVKKSDGVIRATAHPTLVRGPAAFARGPEVSANKTSIDVRFAVPAPIDVAVWVENDKGERVRHLAAGLLGPNAPPPLQKDSLAQQLRWDYRDDFGAPVPPGSYRVQVGLGTQAKLDRVIGWDPTPKQIQGLAVDARGNAIVVGGVRDEWCEVQRFARDGRFTGMLYPPPAKVPPEKLAGMNVIDFGPDGQVRWGSHRTAAYLPHLDQPMPHTPLVNRQGQVIIFGGEYLGGPTRFYKINADGSLPDDFLGPYVKEFNWQQYFDAWAKRFHFALDPRDENVIYLSGLKELHRHEYGEEGKLPRETYYNAVFRLRWNEDAPLEVFAGKRTHHGREGGSAVGEFFDPQGIAFDPAGNLWVCDRGNNRIQVLDATGKSVRQIPHPRPYEVRVAKNGVAYVLGETEAAAEPSKDGKPASAPVRKVTLTKYSTGPTPVGSPFVLGTSMKGHDVKNSMYYWTMAMDESDGRTTVVFVRGEKSDPHQVERLVDLGDRYEGPHVIVGAKPPREYKRLAVGWSSDEVWAGGHWFDATGEHLGEHYAGEVATTRDGRWVTYGGFFPEAISIYGAAWPRDPRMQPQKHWRLDPPALSRAGSRGFCVAPNGDIYVARYYQWQQNYSGRGGMEGPDLHVAIDRYDQEGKLVKQRVVYELSHAAASPAVDVRGNIYVTDNVGRKIGQFYEDDIAANLPSWVPRYDVDWDRLRRGEPVAIGYEKFVYNPLIKSVGTLYKFGPQGGGLIWRAAQGDYVQYKPEITDPKNPISGKFLDWGFPSTPKPNRPATHWSAAWVTTDRLAGMYPRWQEGVQWEFLGVSPVWGRYDKGHSSCVCGNSRIAVDDFGRCFVPAAHRHTVRVVDTAGNELIRIGRYGNMDSAGPGSLAPEVDLPLLFPSATALSKQFLYITEWRHARILRVKVGYERQTQVAVTVP